MEEVFLQAATALLICCESGICFALYVCDGRALAPSEGVELGLLRFSRESVDELLETICAGYDTNLIFVLSMMYHGTIILKRAEEGAGGRTKGKALAD